MSRYITPAILKSTWPAAEVERLATHVAGDPAGASAAIDQAIADAEAMATSLLLSRYPDDKLSVLTPVTTPAVLQTNVAHVAMYNLARHLHNIAPAVERAYTEALRWFRDVAAGRADIGLADAPPVDRSAPQILANKTVADMVFGNGGLDQW